MKKLICTILLIATMTLLLSACGKFTCDFCGQQKRGKRYEVSSLFFGDGIACESCKNEIQNVFN